MKADIATTGVYTDFQGLARLRSASQEDSPEALRAVAKQFEALFLQMMLKNMRDATFGDGIFDSDETKFYQEMFDKQISLSMSERQGLGIADMIVKQLSRDKIDESSGDSKSAGISRSLDKSLNITSPADFVDSLRPVAVKVGEETGVNPEVLMAQAALETGWGKSVIKHPNGRSSHNLFGIKADTSWQGERVVSSTLEYEDGIAVKRNEAFRSYNSFEESFRDYVDFLKNNRRYEHALSQVDNPEKFVGALQEAGYATDPNYANKINGIMKQPVFSVANEPVKDS